MGAVLSAAAETRSGLDVLLHAAGLCRPGIPGQITGEDIDFLVDTNIKATILTNQAAYAVMRNNGGGRIINFDPPWRRARRPGQRSRADTGVLVRRGISLHHRTTDRRRRGLVMLGA